MVHTTCPNCAAELPPDPPPFCAECGQETHLHPPTFFEFVHEFVGHYVALEGALWRTLFALVLRPGKLSAEYFAGRRRRYVLPLRLYISASFVFFLVVKLFGAGGGGIEFNVGLGGADGRPAAELKAGQEALIVKLGRCEERAAGCGWLASRVNALAIRAIEGAGDGRSVEQRMASAAPYAVFLMLPLFAALLKLAYLRRGLSYGAHFVFSLHMHAFWFMAMLLLALLPAEAFPFVVFGVVFHGVGAMRRVYGGAIAATLLRAALVATAYQTAIGLATAVLLVAALLVR